MLDEKIIAWVKNPDSALFLFDGMNTKTKPIVITQIRKIVNNYVYSLNSEIYQRDEAQSIARIKRFVENKRSLGYYSERKNILHFCLYQDVPPEDLVDYVMRNEMEHLYWIQTVNKDIHTSVYLAYKALMFVNEKS